MQQIQNKTQTKRKINLIVIHCTATKEGREYTVEQIDREHRRLGWAGIGYHYVVYLDGSIHAGRPEEKQGAHVSGHNANSIGIAYVGGCDKAGRAKDTRTVAQRAAMQMLIKELLQKYPGARVCGHRDLSPDRNGNGIIEPNEWVKACPCFNAETEYRNIK